MTTPHAKPGTLVLAASAGAVSLWSLTPVGVSAIGSSLGSTEIFLLASLAALIASSVVAFFLRRTLVTILRSRQDWWSGAGWAALSGAFLGMWYFCFYRALQVAPVVEATAISFTWPLIAILAMRLFSPKTAAPLKATSWLLVVMAFLGAVLVTVAEPGASTGEEASRGGLVWALAAAIGSGMYLPFALRAMSRFGRALPQAPATITFLTISVANLTSLVLVSLALVGVQQSVDFSGITPAAAILCAAIGVGVYLLAEVAWTWSFERHGSLTLSSLPYLSPAVSAILLHLFYDAAITLTTAAGLAVIILANLLLHLPGARKDPPMPDKVAVVSRPA